MLLTSHMLVNKLFTTVCASSDDSQETDTLEITQRVLYQAIRDHFRITPVWKCYLTGGKTEVTELSFKLHTAYMEHDNRRIWTARISASDRNNSRRRWIYHICLRDSHHKRISFQYARCCYDHTAGSITPVKGIKYHKDALLDAILHSKQLRCFCGSFPLPKETICLCNSTMSTFLHMLQDRQRTVPIVLITCPDIIIPEQVSDMTVGNLIVFWCGDKHALVKLNSLLPSELRVPWDAVKILMPLNNTNTFHPTYTYDSICRMEPQSFYGGLHQAFCSSMRSEEARNFLTLEDLAREIEHINTKELLLQFAEKKKQLSSSQEQCKKLSTENAALQKSLSIQKQEYEQSEKADYEALLNEAISETETLKRDISALSSQLYSTMGKNFHPNLTPKSAVLQELAHAIYVCLACANSKK